MPPGHFAAVAPEVAEVELLGPLEQSIQGQYRRLQTLRGRLSQLTEIFHNARAGRRREEMVAFTRTADETKVWVADAARYCRSEVLVMQPGGGRDHDELREEAQVFLPLLRRGVKMRIIYQHAARTDIPTRNHIRELIGGGAEVRTINDAPEQMMIFDQEVAFVPQRSHSKRGHGATIVYESAVVGTMWHIYEHFWRSSTLFNPEEAAYGETLNDIRTTILGLLAVGLTDDVIARRLGISSRTCRRHISTIMNQLKATSRFQAGVMAARARLLPE